MSKRRLIAKLEWEAILRFMEKHPSVDYGAIGALVHFVERYYGI